jgi:hypothetical protein
MVSEMLNLCNYTLKVTTSVHTAMKNPIYIFLFWELRGLSPNFHIHVSVSDLYMYSEVCPHIFASRQIDRGNI